MSQHFSFFIRREFLDAIRSGNKRHEVRNAGEFESRKPAPGDTLLLYESEDGVVPTKPGLAINASISYVSTVASNGVPMFYIMSLQNVTAEWCK